MLIEIIGGDLNKAVMVGDSEVDSISNNAKIPFLLVEDGYTEKKLIKLNMIFSLKIF